MTAQAAQEIQIQQTMLWSRARGEQHQSDHGAKHAEGVLMFERYPHLIDVVDIFHLQDHEHLPGHGPRHGLEKEMHIVLGAEKIPGGDED